MTTATLTPTSTRRRGTGLNPVYLRIEMLRMLRNPWTLGFSLVMPIGMYLLFGATASWGGEWLGHGNVAGVVLTQMTMYGAMSAAASVAATVASERRSGWNRQLRLTPLRGGAYVLGKLLCSGVVGFVLCVVMYVVGAATGARLDPGTAVATFALAWIGGTGLFAAFGLAVSYLFSGEEVIGVVGPAMTLLAFVGGIFIPLEVLGSFMASIAPFTPMWGIGQISRDLVAGSGVTPLAVVNVLGWFAVFVGVAAWRYRRVAARV